MARRALLVGVGGFGREWARTLQEHPDVELVGWISQRAESARRAAQAVGLPALFTGTDLGAALTTLRPDLVVDVTPPEVHHEITLTALAAGVPVLGEKPMADSLVHARAMVAAAERANVLYMVSQSRRAP